MFRHLPKLSKTLIVSGFFSSVNPDGISFQTLNYVKLTITDLKNKQTNKRK